MLTAGEMQPPLIVLVIRPCHWSVYSTKDGRWECQSILGGLIPVTVLNTKVMGLWNSEMN